MLGSVRRSCPTDSPPHCSTLSSALSFPLATVSPSTVSLALPSGVWRKRGSQLLSALPEGEGRWGLGRLTPQAERGSPRTPDSLWLSFST